VDGDYPNRRFGQNSRGGRDFIGGRDLDGKPDDKAIVLGIVERGGMF
jgi:hypothetical protein